MSASRFHQRVTSALFGGLFIGAAALAAPLNMSLALTPSNYHGYNISCFGEKDGSIDLTVTGGTSPYTYKWSNGPTTQDISGVPAGYYKVEVVDHNGQTLTAELTLTEPLLLKADIDVYQYPNGYNVSCFNCSNGNAEVVVLGGAAPFSYAWSDGPTLSNRYNLGPNSYTLEVADANGCTYNSTIYLQQPDRSDWTMDGNDGTDPATQYIGTSDNKDVVFRSNGSERLRLLGNGTIKMSGLSGGDDGYLGISGAGLLQFHPFHLQGTPIDFWSTSGNWLNQTDQWLGTKDDRELVVKTNNTERMRLTTSGRLGIGTIGPECDLHINHDGADAKVLISSSTGSATLWTRSAGYAFALSTDAAGQGHLLRDATNPVPVMSFASNGNVGIGTTDLNNTDYGLYVTRGILTEKVKVALESTWPDFVFHSDYALMSLEDIHRYIQENGHLPGVPSAQEVSAQGIDVAKDDAMLLQKIEELTLLVIQLNERITQLESKK